MEKHMNRKIMHVTSMVVLCILFALVACSPETPPPDTPQTPSEPDDSKKLSEISMLRHLGEMIEDSDCNIGETLTGDYDVFEGLELFPAVIYGKYDGIWNEPYFIGSDGAKWYLWGDEEGEHAIVMKEPQPSQDPSFSISVDEDDEGNVITEVKNLKFTMELIKPESKELSVDLSGRVVSSETNTTIDITLNGRTYPTLTISMDEEGCTFTYDGYTNRHIHVFDDWHTDEDPTDVTAGKEYSYCDECDFRTEREIPPSNTRGVSLNKSDKLYDGKKADILADITFAGSGTPRIEFKPSAEDDDSKYSENAPIDAGYYSVRITVPADDQYKYDSVYEGSYDILPLDITITDSKGLFETRTYNGEKHKWEVVLSGSNSSEGYYKIEGMPSGEEIKVTVETDSIDAGTYRFTYDNIPDVVSTGSIQVEALGDNTKTSNYYININVNPRVEPAALTGTLKATKPYDDTTSFEVSDITGLDGIIESDKEGLVIEMRRESRFPSDPNKVASVRIMKNGTDITKNYSTANAVFEAEVTPKKLTFNEFGKVLQTPYLKTNLDVNQYREIRLGVKNGVVRGYITLDRRNTYEKLEKDSEISFDSFYVQSSNYSLSKEDSPEKLKVVSVNDDIDALSTSFSIGKDEYRSCKFEMKQGEVLVIGGNGKADVLAYVCDSSGIHYNVDYPNENHTITIQDGFKENRQYYLFLYSANGASNLTVGIVPSKSN